MPDGGHGLATATTGVLMGVMVESMLSSFVSAGIIDPSIMIIYHLINILAIFAFVHVTKYWGTFYLFGWWAGLGLMRYAGLVGDLEFTIYSIILVSVLITRALRRIED